MLDRSTFDNTAGFLARIRWPDYVQAIAAQAGRLFLALRGRDSPGMLAESAHSLAGSAGLMGFTRLSMLARRFEHGVMTSDAELPLLARSLSAAIEITLRDMNQLLRHKRRSEAAPADPASAGPQAPRRRRHRGLDLDAELGEAGRQGRVESIRRLRCRSGGVSGQPLAWNQSPHAEPRHQGPGLRCARPCTAQPQASPRDHPMQASRNHHARSPA